MIPVAIFAPSLTLPQINSSQLIRVWIVRSFVVDCGACSYFSWGVTSGLGEWLSAAQWWY
jgi:hypothetical protein